MLKRQPFGPNIISKLEFFNHASFYPGHYIWSYSPINSAMLNLTLNHLIILGKYFLYVNALNDKSTLFFYFKRLLTVKNTVKIEPRFDRSTVILKFNVEAKRTCISERIR